MCFMCFMCFIRFICPWTHRWPAGPCFLPFSLLSSKHIKDKTILSFASLIPNRGKKSWLKMIRFTTAFLLIGILLLCIGNTAAKCHAICLSKELGKLHEEVKEVSLSYCLSVRLSHSPSLPPSHTHTSFLTLSLPPIFPVFPFLVACYATLHDAMSVCLWSVCFFFHFTAPADQHATRAAVYTALFQRKCKVK